MNFIRSKEASSLPTPPGLQDWPTYGTEYNIMDIGEHGFESKPDPWETRDICPTLIGAITDPSNGN